ncbi:MAG: ice-binding family protein, partial [Chitinophagaceae bacterium]|nr:ice-binding family protein [Chitinophagaceae bacterium]
MKKKLLLIMAVILLCFPKVIFGQAINLGAASNFVLFTSAGAVGDNASSHSHLTGDIGYETSGAITGFGNVNGVMHPGVDAATTAGGLALLSAIAQINTTAATIFPPSGSLGNGDVFTPGVYSVTGDATLTSDLILDAEGDPNAEFIIKISGTFSANANSKVKLINEAMACHVFWQVGGVVSMASGATMRGNIIGGAAINMATGVTLEGRALTTVGAITIDGITAYTPIGCGSPYLTGPPAPDLASAACYTIFSSNGALANTPVTTSIGDVGNNGGGSITGWTAGDVTGTLHPIPDASTAQCAADLLNVYNYLNTLPYDIELLYPAQFGSSLVLTPHTYLMNAAATFTDTLYLNAQGNANAVFVIQINGALSTSTYAKVELINGAQAKNVFWMVQGAVDINNYSVFRGTIVVPVGAINLVNTGVVLDGRALTMDGAITTAGLAAAMPPGCGITAPSITAQPTDQTACAGSSVSFSVTATGTGLTYQWRKGTLNLTDGVNISGATSAILTINSVNISDAASDYNVVITDTYASNVTSNNVSLVVNPLPIASIITAGVATTFCEGDNVILSGNSDGTWSNAATAASITVT